MKRAATFLFSERDGARTPAQNIAAIALILLLGEWAVCGRLSWALFWTAIIVVARAVARRLVPKGNGWWVIGTAAAATGILQLAFGAGFAAGLWRAFTTFVLLTLAAPWYWRKWRPS